MRLQRADPNADASAEREDGERDLVPFGLQIVAPIEAMNLGRESPLCPVVRIQSR
jgi:hypothetical protein